MNHQITASTPNDIDLSVIVPAYKAEGFIGESLKALIETTEKITQNYEIIVVSDGNTDKTLEIANKFSSPHVKVLGYDKNMGKGFALKYGVEHSSGKFVTFIDADMNILPKEIGIFLKLMDIYDADIIIGSKRHPQSKVNYPILRRFQSWIYQMLIRILFDLDVKDTQTGLKLFRRNVIKKVIPRVVVKRFAFDLEFLVVAKHLGFTKILEAPVEIKAQFFSTTNYQAIHDTLRDTLAIFYRLKITKYYDQEPK